ncbi:hypothetical protein L2E82_25575 [Cichorium intybus]|uniref:Uncharacterized protein n=1 Tax=Cichorium intybus TaxID=13427 RepID=A0ACB9E4A7_CICIN|nr:hypothetical protein L2E82_25575 [Cichorium intybus]
MVVGGVVQFQVNNCGIGGVVRDEEAFKASRTTGNEATGSHTELIKILIESNEFAVQCVETNYYGVKRMVDHFIPLLESWDSPRIVNVSASWGKLKGLNNEWAKGILSDIENLIEEKIDEVVNDCYGILDGKLKLRAMTLPNRYIDHGAPQDQLEEARESRNEGGHDNRVGGGSGRGYGRDRGGGGGFNRDPEVIFCVPCECSRCASIDNTPYSSKFNMSIFNPKESSTSKKVTCTCPYLSSYISSQTSTSGISMEDFLHLETNDSMDKLSMYLSDSGSNAPPKPWERAVRHLTCSPPGSTTYVVEASGPGEIFPSNDVSTTNANSLGRPVLARPWMQPNTYGIMCGGLYGNTMYEGGHGGLFGGSRGMYNNSFGGPMGGGNGIGPGYLYGGDQDPNNQFGSPSSPPRF